MACAQPLVEFGSAIPLETIDESGQPEPPADQPDLPGRPKKNLFGKGVGRDLRTSSQAARGAATQPAARIPWALSGQGGIATFRQMAEALGMSPEKLPELWSELPLEDTRIAELLQLTRQQVINARKSARNRLTRRLRGLFDDDGNK
jgi:hypothetical protein